MRAKNRYPALLLGVLASGFMPLGHAATAAASASSAADDSGGVEEVIVTAE